MWIKEGQGIGHDIGGVADFLFFNLKASLTVDVTSDNIDRSFILVLKSKFLCRRRIVDNSIIDTLIQI